MLLRLKNRRTEGEPEKEEPAASMIGGDLTVKETKVRANLTMRKVDRKAAKVLLEMT